MSKTRQEIEELKREWMADGIWDIEETEGFEDHRDELCKWRLEYERRQQFPPITDLELAKIMVAYGEMSNHLAMLSELIQNAVLDRGKTVTTGNVKATFNSVRKEYPSWEDLVRKDIPDFNEKPYESTMVMVDWQAAAADLGLKREGKEPADGMPSVTIKTTLE